MPLPDSAAPLRILIVIGKPCITTCEALATLGDDLKGADEDVSNGAVPWDAL